MASTKVTVDTNFFITLFSKDVDRFYTLSKILKKLSIKLVLSSYVRREMRWYMERVIAPHCDIINLDPATVEEYERKVRPKVGSLPQTPDVSVAYVADKYGIALVSSDLKLIQISEKLGIKTFMNSAFAIYLISKTEDEEDRKFLEQCKNDLFAEEVSYSVKSQNVYDPVIRIQAIMDSALKVVREGAALPTKIEDIPINEEYDFYEYKELRDVTLGFRRDLDAYVDQMNSASLETLYQQLEYASKELMDRCAEVRLLDVPETDPVYKEALTTLAHILLLLASVSISEQQIKKAESVIDQLLLLLFEVSEVAEKLEMEVHLQRIVILFLTDQLKRFNVYFSPAFYQKCESKGREDVINLLRTFSILSAVIGNNKSEESAVANDFSEIEFTIQLGFQFINIGQPEKAWLMLEQAVYMSVNSKMIGLLYAVMEVLLPLHFHFNMADKEITPSINQLIDYIEENAEDMPMEPYRQRLILTDNPDQEILIKRAKAISNLPTSLRGFLDVISAEKTKFSRLGEVTLVSVIDWETMNLIGIIDPSNSLDEKLTVGSSVSIQSGKVRLIQAPAKLRKLKKLNLVIVCKEEGLEFLVRRSGSVSVIQSRDKITAYDL